MSRRLACAALLAVMPAWGDGRIQVDAADVHYDIAGTTDVAILEALRAQAQAIGKDHFAEAGWGVRWNYGYDQSGRGPCRIRDLRIQLAQRTTLPRWNPAGAPAELVARWERFMTALRVHEAGHASHGRDAAEEISRTLGRMRDADCARLGREANAAGEAIVARHAERDRQYDQETRHGRDQGAWWQVDIPQRQTAKPSGMQPPRMERPQLESMPAPALPAR